MKLFELKSIQKAGVVPYIREDDKILYMFMVPSDTHYGGPHPQIAKGQIDAGENTEAAAFREAKEELGLKKSNLKKDTVQLAWKGTLEGEKDNFTMSIYIGEVQDKNDFTEPTTDETGSIHWLSAKEFSKNGRHSQVAIIDSIERLLSDKNSL
jgi:8-oxo-dGTP pyrophosphatase MutT (NUDIX family)